MDATNMPYPLLMSHLVGNGQPGGPPNLLSCKCSLELDILGGSSLEHVTQLRVVDWSHLVFYRRKKKGWINL